MHIAGGLYREQCYIPEWDKVYGSGGRAASAISALSPGSTLHTYSEAKNSEHNISRLEKLGINVSLSERPTPIVFTYFHSLSIPHIQPPPEKILNQPSIRVSGETVLRFGFLEGDAIVSANRVVYDPQTWKNPEPFRKNGSVANELAIVLNEAELFSISGIDNQKLSAMRVIEQQEASAVIVKRGIRGATVYEKNGDITKVPAYKSTRVFKIGTGDVFSAMFAFYWGEKNMMPKDAADKASRSVAAFCSSRILPVDENLINDLVPVNYMGDGAVLLEGMIDTMGQRFTMEEARYVLRDLGVDVFCPALNDRKSYKYFKSVLIVADGISETEADIILKNAGKKPVVVLKEKNVNAPEILTCNHNVVIADDFASAIYLSAWDAIG